MSVSDYVEFLLNFRVLITNRPAVDPELGVVIFLLLFLVYYDKWVSRLTNCASASRLSLWMR
jgi:hypothetical protein